MDGAVVAQELLHRRRDRRGIRHEALPFGRVTEEGEEAVADQVHGGLVAGDVQQHARREQLPFGQAIPGLLDGDERGEEVGAGLASPPGDQPLEVTADGPAGRSRAGDHVGLHGHGDGVEAAGEVERPLLDSLGILARHAEQLGDDGDGQGVREIGDHVHPAPGGHPIEEAVDQRLDVGSHGLDDPWRERLADEGAQARVIRGVGEEHRRRRPRLLGVAAEAGGEEGLIAPFPEPRVAEEQRHVVVARERVEAERVAVDRVLAAEPVVEGVGVGDEGGIERVELGHGRSEAS